MPGEYSLGNATACVTCPAGEACPSTRSDAAITCAAGTYSLGGATDCTICPRGHACPSTTTSTETDCLPGTYSIGGQDTCSSCPPGYACPSVFDDIHIPCPSGFYSLGEQTACIVSEASWLHLLRVLHMLLFFSFVCHSRCLASSTLLQRCPPGSFCSNTTALPVVCDDGYYSQAGRTECLVRIAAFSLEAWAFSVADCPCLTSSTPLPSTHPLALPRWLLLRRQNDRAPGMCCWNIQLWTDNILPAV